MCGSWSRKRRRRWTVRRWSIYSSIISGGGQCATTLYSSNANTSAVVVSVRQPYIVAMPTRQRWWLVCDNVCDNISGRQYIVASSAMSCDNMGGGVGGMQWTARRWSRKRTARQHGGGRGSGQHGGRGSGQHDSTVVVEEAVVEVCIITTTWVVEEAVVEVCDNPHLDKGEVAPTLKNIW